MSTDPTVLANSHFIGVLDVISPALHFRFVGGSKNTDVWAEHSPCTDGDNATVQDAEIEVRIDSIAHADVASVVDSEWGLDEAIVAYLADDFLQLLVAMRCQGLKVGFRIIMREPIVVSMTPRAGFES